DEVIEVGRGGGRHRRSGRGPAGGAILAGGPRPYIELGEGSEPRKASRGMKIVQYPHPALRYPAKPVTAIDKGLRLLAGRMLELTYDAKGLGLAAPQVAVPLQL